MRRNAVGSALTMTNLGRRISPPAHLSETLSVQSGLGWLLLYTWLRDMLRDNPENKVNKGVLEISLHKEN